jgi:hypothetical protein
MTHKVSLSLFRLFTIVFGLLADVACLGRVALRSRASLIAENLAFYRERQVKHRRLSDSARLSLFFWSRWFDWRSALVVVRPETLIGWHRRAFQASIVVPAMACAEGLKSKKPCEKSLCNTRLVPVNES